MALIIGVLAVGTPAYFPGFAIPSWGIVIGVWLFAAGRVSHPAAVTTQRTA
jgi:hypothetical protein